MAINKSRTSPLMKTGIILLAGMFIVALGFTGLGGLASCSPNAPLLPGGTATSASTDTTAAIQAINLKYSPSIQAREASITADPKDYTLLVTQANAYFDWASEVLQATKQQTSADAALWKSAVPYYQRALTVKPGDPSVTTDYSIAQFYSGDVTSAISTVETVRKADPTFAQAAFNLGVFYASLGTADGYAKATASFEAYLKLEPTGTNAADAKKYISELASASSATTGSTPATGQ